VTSETDIDTLRDEIDCVDSQILELVARRIVLVQRIGEYKHAKGLPVYDAERERAVIQRLTQAAPSTLEPGVVKRVFERIIDESRGIEQHWVAKNG
jgi:chorismate mutase